MGEIMSEIKTQYYICDNCKEPCDPVTKIELINESGKTDAPLILYLSVNFYMEFIGDMHICEKCLYAMLNRKLSTPA